MFNDTIAAISTPHGVGALSVIRVSGKNAVEISDKLTNKDLFSVKANNMVYSRLHYLDSDKILDEAMVCVMKGPNSFTGEDTVEFFCHGGLMVAKTLLRELISAGCRMAEPGEYTKRAFLNGKLDLVKAESISELIHSATESSYSLAADQMQGRLSDEINSYYDELVLVAAHVAAVLDYPDEGVPDVTAVDLQDKITSIAERLEKLLKNSENGIITINGLNVVLAGKPNVGKSSLLNDLLGEDRAIVTSIPGTTRDILKEQANIGGYLINLSDTAGVRQTSDIVEKKGVDRTLAGIENADLILLVLDLSRPLDEDDEKLLSLTESKERIIVFNKSDVAQYNFDFDGIYVSAKNNTGIDILCDKISNFAARFDVKDNAPAITNLRQQDLIIRTLNVLNSINFELATVDLILCDLEAAINILGEVTGKNVSESVIEKVFENFCVGK